MDTCGGNRFMQRLEWRANRKRDEGAGLNVRESISINLHLREIECGGGDSINLAQNRNRWRALVNAAMNL
jgi:hypothetical protein